MINRRHCEVAIKNLIDVILEHLTVPVLFRLLSLSATLLPSRLRLRNHVTLKREAASCASNVKLCYRCILLLLGAVRHGNARINQGVRSRVSLVALARCVIAFFGRRIWRGVVRARVRRSQPVFLGRGGDSERVEAKGRHLAHHGFFVEFSAASPSLP